LQKKMAKGGSSQPTQQNITQSNLPEYARPYFEGLMQRANTSLTTPYIPYGYTQNKTTGEVERAINPATGKPVANDRIADFTPEQQQLQQNILNQQTPGEFGQAGNFMNTAAQGTLANAQYSPGQFGAQQIGLPNLQQYSMGPVRDVQGQQYDAPQMQAAQTGYQPNLNYFQMQGPEKFGSAQAQQYMSPYAEAVMEPQKREAIRSAKQGQLAQDLRRCSSGYLWW